LTADLGLDKVMIYQIDRDGGKLRPNDPPWATVHPGAGPRHFDFHPNGRYAYLINEIDSTMTAFSYDAARGALTELHSLPTLPQGFDGRSSCADVHVHPSGKYLYGSNRGHDSIVIYGIDEATGRLTYIGHEPTQGRTPRGFNVDPSGNFLLAANQNTDTVVSFRIDPATGRLAATGHVAQVPTPVCLKFR
jgi:6-phosphogluconolactonase